MAHEMRFGIAGFGEVGATFARHLATAGEVSVADPRFSSDPGLTELAAGLRLHVVRDTEALAAASDVVVCAVTPTAARDAAEAAARADHVLFVDFNSISPVEKQSLAALFADGSYIDGAILGSIAAQGAQTPLTLSGPRAEEACLALETAGLQVAITGAEVGAASALKMCRSIFMKGVECLFLETVLAAAQFGITDAVLESVEQTFQALGFQGTVRMLLTTHAAHCERRASEMEKVTAMLAEMCLPYAMSAASREMLAASARSRLAEHVGGKVPSDPAVTTEYLGAFYRKECG